MIRQLPVFPEHAIGCIGAAVAATMLAIGSRPDVAGLSLVCLAGYYLALRYTESSGIPRITANYLAVWAIYSGSGPIIDALGRPDYATVLLAWDRQLFGESPAIRLQSVASPWTNEVLGAAYLSYLVYVHWVLGHAIFLPADRRMHYTRPLFTSLGLGFSIYFLVPASSIGVAFPELFVEPVKGFWITSLVDVLVVHAAAPYDSFPSVHVLATGVMLACDFALYRRRFWIMLPPSVVMAASTILLRMHYAVDLIASVVILIPLVWFIIGGKTQ